MSSVVQNLEHVAVSDPQYGTTTTTSSSTIVPQEGTADAASAAPLDVLANPPPPPPPPPGSFAPMAYNPAAPAAPEAIRHREKTPPPDEDPLNPLAVAVAHDYQKQPFTPAFPPQSLFTLAMTSPGLPPNITNSSSLPPQFSGPPRQLSIPTATTIPANSASAFSGLPGSPGFVPPPLSQPATQVPGHSSVAPPGGFSNYTYSHQSSVRQDSKDYSIHQQLYQPTQVEFGVNNSHQYQTKTEPRGRLEESAGRLERGVSGMLKKFEKKFG
ncbi:uncharacterized protein MAM_04720 [Metarhizium album ARSEF 1941]|uniref:Uncharacterized protein n=1 Tax=Metarhizium album (strain ARSEF 1941) TaxID=1081103 RepID=A0A0B2WXX5_METAS|nr:uncharacterized protein MAM_04720 [Metarhizium album ARSEF 1941]KHN97705.1 hypothetical protein MAM_04720 [Metarhizium album ARSEF 1941]